VPKCIRGNISREHAVRISTGIQTFGFERVAIDATQFAAETVGLPGVPRHASLVNPTAAGQSMRHAGLNNGRQDFVPNSTSQCFLAISAFLAASVLK